MKHTKGPWNISSDGIIYAGNDSATAIELGFVAQVSDQLIGVSEARANGVLMAASPDLLDALKKLAHEVRGFKSLASAEFHGNTNMAVLEERIVNAFDAIRRAESA